MDALDAAIWKAHDAIRSLSVIVALGVGGDTAQNNTRAALRIMQDVCELLADAWAEERVGE